MIHRFNLHSVNPTLIHSVSSQKPDLIWPLPISPFLTANGTGASNGTGPDLAAFHPVIGWFDMFGGHPCQGPNSPITRSAPWFTSVVRVTGDRPWTRSPHICGYRPVTSPKSFIGWDGWVL